MAFKNLVLSAVAAATVLSAVPAGAVQVVFAKIDLLNADRNFLWRRTNSTGGTFNTTSTPGAINPGATSILFSLVGSPVPLSVTANFLLQGTTVADPLGSNNPNFSQQIDSFTFNITAANAFCWGPSCFNAGDSLLSGSVQNSRITGTLGQTTALFSGVGPGATVSFTSPLVSFDPGSNLGFNFDLTGMDRVLAGAAQNSIGSFRSQISGTFSSDPEATFNVPEPGTWALMIIGMGLVGAARRRRRTVVAA